MVLPEPGDLQHYSYPTGVVVGTAIAPLWVVSNVIVMRPNNNDLLAELRVTAWEKAKYIFGFNGSWRIE